MNFPVSKDRKNRPIQRIAVSLHTTPYTAVLSIIKNIFPKTSRRGAKVLKTQRNIKEGLTTDYPLRFIQSFN
jgi:hypothetical protein